MDPAFLQHLRETFRLEAEELLAEMAQGLLDLEQAPSRMARREILERIFRGAHSLKGAARAVNMDDVQAVCQVLESLFARMKEGRLASDPALFDTLHEAVSVVRRLAVEGAAAPVSEIVEHLQAWVNGTPSAPNTAAAPEPAVPEPAALEPAAPEPAVPEPAVPEAAVPEPAVPEAAVPEPAVPEPAAPEPAVSEPATPVGGDAMARGPATPAPRPGGQEVVRIAVDKLEALRLQAEELHAVRQRAEQRVNELRELVRRIARGRAERERHIDGEASLSLAEVEREVRLVLRETERDQRVFEGMLGQLITAARSVLMLPFDTVLQPLRPMVRDVARTLGKDAVLVVEGGDIEVDKRILEAVRDPLIHLLRNAVDHGLEAPEARERAGKPARGTLRAGVRRRADGKVELTLSDDGRGLDVEALRQAARKRGLAGADALTPEEAAGLIFQSGLSTSPIVTEISGRGLGMAIVQAAIERLGGEIGVTTKRGEGTTFRLVLPETLAMFRGVLVRVGKERFALPTMPVERVVRVPREQVRTVAGKSSVEVGGAVYALASLAEVLERPAPSPETPWLHLVLVHAGARRVAFAVDEVLREQELLARDLGRQLRRVRNVAGVTVLGSGAIVPILNVEDLLRAATGRAGRTVFAAETTAVPRTALVVDDSLTTRMLIKNVLEGAGYVVTTATDGLDGLEKVESNAFDVVVTDVEMPRLNGFDLTARIRERPGGEDLPVVLLTSLASEEDRRRGVEAGADAYFVKSEFDQGSLLDVIEGLIS